MKTLVFESARFRPYLPDDCQVNPNVLGFELASWLAKALAERGVVTSYPFSEDWGWFLEMIDGKVEYMICCSGSATDGDAYAWTIYVNQPKRFLRRPALRREEAILEEIARVLQDSGISTTMEE